MNSWEEDLHTMLKTRMIRIHSGSFMYCRTFMMYNVGSARCHILWKPNFLSSMMVKKKITGHNVAKHLFYHFNIYTVVTVD